MEQTEELSIKSEEVQEILGTPPSWLIRWGTSIAFITFLAIGWASYFLEYHDTVKGNIRVASTDPPQKVRAEERALISDILVQNEDSVITGQALLAFKSRAKFEDVLTLENHLLSVRNRTDSAVLSLQLPNDLILGELEDDYYDFVNDQELVRLEQSGNVRKQSIRTLEKELNQARNGIRNEKKKKANLLEQINLVEKRYQREQNLLRQNLTTANAVEMTQEELLSLERMLKTIEWNIKNNEFIISSRREEINGVERGSVESLTSAAIELRESFGRLARNLEEWKRTYLITSPVNGVVILDETIGEQQYVFSGAEIMEIVPTDLKETVGKMNLSIKGSGRVQLGQKVLVKLESYPYPEFGAIEGRISRIGIVSIDNQVPAEVSFPKGLVTTNGRKIENAKMMKGQATIIVEEKRFIERVFERVRRAWI